MARHERDARDLGEIPAAAAATLLLDLARDAADADLAENALTAAALADAETWPRLLQQQLGALRGRVYQGVWGSAPFQSLYQPAAGTLLSLPLMPEWYLLILLLAFLALHQRCSPGLTKDPFES